MSAFISNKGKRAYIGYLLLAATFIVNSEYNLWGTNARHLLYFYRFSLQWFPIFSIHQAYPYKQFCILYTSDFVSRSAQIAVSTSRNSQSKEPPELCRVRRGKIDIKIARKA